MDSKAGRVRVTGPLVEYAAGFATELSRIGYTENATADQVRLLAHLSRWLAGHRLAAADLTHETCDAFLAARRAEGYTLWLSRQALVPMLDYLRDIGVVPPVPAASRSPREALLAHYHEYLISERGLKHSTASGYINFVTPFLRQRETPEGRLRLDDLRARDITSFVVATVPGRPMGSAKLTVCALRSLLGFLHINGMLSQSLVAAVPSVAGSRLAGLPKALERGQVQQLLATCDRSTAVGGRDYAVLTMLTRLGLRAGEVAAMELDDIDWRSGEIIVRGKGDRRERLPLPVDVGRALSAYLRRARPVSECRSLFMRVRAPHRGLTSAGVGAIVSWAARKAGLPPTRSHRLRHTAATQMLRSGASLAEVGQVLRHRSALSTAIYAKVDRLALRQIARPWPDGSAA
ncbi:MAG TPA: site-specific integrase [Ktedonobacterales bacterium]|nr:site-specific integrase [Ktedonobacterales bacterium]